jgi:Protein of unknown function (DUF4245)
VAAIAVAVTVVAAVPRSTSVPRSISAPRSATVADVDEAAAFLGYRPYVGLPAGWTVTGSRLRYDTSGLPAWSLDYVTDHGTSVGLEQVQGWTASWQGSLTHGGRPGQRAEAAGRRFETYLMAPRAITSWLLREGRHTTLVLVKDGGDADARRLAESLQVAP